MVKKLKNKFFLFGIITILFLLMIPQNSIATEQNIIDNYNETGEWKTNYYCRVNVYCDYGDCQPELGLFFVRSARITGNIARCSISGTNGKDVYESGKLDLRVEYLFGYCRFYWQSWLSWADMRGFAFICKYKVE